MQTSITISGTNFVSVPTIVEAISSTGVITRAEIQFHFQVLQHLL
jgi:hypothetical protein